MVKRKRHSHRVRWTISQSSSGKNKIVKVHTIRYNKRSLKYILGRDNGVSFVKCLNPSYPTFTKKSKAKALAKFLNVEQIGCDSHFQERIGGRLYSTHRGQRREAFRRTISKLARLASPCAKGAPRKYTVGKMGEVSRFWVFGKSRRKSRRKSRFTSIRKSSNRKNCDVKRVKFGSRKRKGRKSSFGRKRGHKKAHKKLHGKLHKKTSRRKTHRKGKCSFGLKLSQPLAFGLNYGFNRFV